MTRHFCDECGREVTDDYRAILVSVSVWSGAKGVELIPGADHWPRIEVCPSCLDGVLRRLKAARPNGYVHA